MPSSSVGRRPSSADTDLGPVRHTAVTVRIGISGWTYPPWRGEFYPAAIAGIAKSFRNVAERMNSVEINGSFYSLQRRSSFETWAPRSRRTSSLRCRRAASSRT